MPLPGHSAGDAADVIGYGEKEIEEVHASGFSNVLRQHLQTNSLAKSEIR